MYLQVESRLSGVDEFSGVMLPGLVFSSSEATGVDEPSLLEACVAMQGEVI